MQEHVGRSPGSTKIHSVAWSEMNSHFRYPVSYRSTIAKIPTFSGSDAFDNSGLAARVLQVGQPSVELFRSEDGVQRPGVYLIGYKNAIEPPVENPFDNIREA